MPILQNINVFQHRALKAAELSEWGVSVPDYDDEFWLDISAVDHACRAKQLEAHARDAKSSDNHKKRRNHAAFTKVLKQLRSPKKEIKLRRTSAGMSVEKKS